MPDGRAANQPDPATTLSPPIGAPFPGAVVSAAVIGSPASSVAATAEEKEILTHLSPEQVEDAELAGEPIIDKLTTAPGNGAPIGGLKVVAESGWFAARPSGTEDVYKLYAESFRGPAHLAAIQDQAREIIAAAIGGS